MRTHYDNLKVAPKAPPEVIKAAYRALAQKYHPDRNPGDQEAARIMVIVNTAYEVLSDPVRRQQHDDWIASKSDLTPNQDRKSSPPPNEGGYSSYDEMVKEYMPEGSSYSVIPCTQIELAGRPTTFAYKPVQKKTNWNSLYIWVLVGFLCGLVGFGPGSVFAFGAFVVHAIVLTILWMVRLRASRANEIYSGRSCVAFFDSGIVLFDDVVEVGGKKVIPQILIAVAWKDLVGYKYAGVLGRLGIKDANGFSMSFCSATFLPSGRSHKHYRRNVISIREGYEYIKSKYEKGK